MGAVIHGTRRAAARLLPLLAVGLLAGCGSDDPAPPTSAVGGTTAKTVAASTATAASPAAARVKRPVRGPGKLLGPVLVYRRDDPDMRYVAFFRTEHPFVAHDDVGTTIPGVLQVEDAEDSHDGYAGSIGPGTPVGKCYWWVLEPAPGLDRVPAGSRADVTLRLHGTSVQRTKVKVRDMPQDGTDDPALRADLAAIGCGPPPV